MNVWDKCMTVLISVGLFTLGFVGLCLAALFLSGCAHQQPPAPLVASETITIHAYTPQHVELCVENPDIWIATKPRLVCKRLLEVRQWYALTRAAD